MVAACFEKMGELFVGKKAVINRRHSGESRNPEIR